MSQNTLRSIRMASDFDTRGMDIKPTPQAPQQGECSIDVSSFPYWNQPPLGAEAFDYVGYITLPAIGTFPYPAIIDFVVPKGRNGIIKKFGNAYVGTGFTEGTGGLQWQLLADTVPIQNYDNIPASLGSTANPSEVASIRIKENQRIQLVINNIAVLAAVTFTGGRLGGWFYPKWMESRDAFI